MHEHHRLVGHLQGQLDVLFHHDHRGPVFVGHPADDRHQRLDGHRGEPQGHLVDEQQLR